MFPVSFFVMLYDIAKRAPNRKKTVFSTVKAVIVTGVVYLVAFSAVEYYMINYEEDDLVIEFVCFTGIKPAFSKDRVYDNGTHDINMSCRWWEIPVERHLNECMRSTLGKISPWYCYTTVDFTSGR